MNKSELIIKEIIGRFPSIVPYLKGRAYGIALSESIKTYEYYLSTLTRMVRNLYNGYTTENEFVSILESLITGQFRKAWYEGMTQNELKPKDMTEAWQSELDGLITYEFQFIADFAKAITDAKKNETGLDGLLTRAELWANRYNEVVSHAALATAKNKQRMIWKLGATEKHCPYCKDLHNIVAYAEEWEQLGVMPQNAPNPALTGERNGEKGCEGWHCDCSLSPTDQRRSPNAFDTIFNIVSK